MSRRLRLDEPIAHRPDQNVRTYRPEDDGRNIRLEDRIQFVAVGRVHASTNQTRLVETPVADALLEEDIESNGLTHPPLLRPHPAIPGEFEVVAGHRRVAALRRLAQRGRGENLIRGAGAPEERLIPCIVEPLDDLAAHSKTIGENLVRQDISAWEQAVALAGHQEVLAKAGKASAGPDVAAETGQNYRTIAPYLKVARALTPDVLREANAWKDDRPDHEALATLKLEPLRRVAQEPEERRSKRLSAELLARAGRRGRVPSVGRRRRPEGASEVLTLDELRGRPLQINTRRALGDLTPDRARDLLGLLMRAAVVLHASAYPAQSVRYLNVTRQHTVVLVRDDEEASDRFEATRLLEVLSALGARATD